MNYIIKTALIGDYGVGKSSIVSQYIDNKFYEHCSTTLGVDFHHKIVDFKENRYKLQIWDTAGQEKFESIVKSYIRDLDVCILVFDVNCMKSFEKLERWIYLVKHIAEKKNYIYLVGNKSDLYNENKTNNNIVNENKTNNNIVNKNKKVLPEDINNFCFNYDIEYIECSAKNKENINNIFLNIIDKIETMTKKDEIKLRTFNDFQQKKIIDEDKKCWIIS